MEDLENNQQDSKRTQQKIKRGQSKKFRRSLEIAFKNKVKEVAIENHKLNYIFID